MSRYCKAYQLSRLRQFSGWTEQSENARPVERAVGNDTVDVPRTLGDDDYVFLHQNLVVTDGVVQDEYIIFETDRPEWADFCRATLEFEIPPDLAA